MGVGLWDGNNVLIRRVSHSVCWYLGTKLVVAWWWRGQHGGDGKQVRYGSKESLCRMEEGAVQVGSKLYPFMVTRFKVVLYLESEPWSRNRAGHMKEWGFGREKGVRIFTPLFRGRMIFTWDRRKNHLTLRLISWIPNKHILPTIFYKTSLIQFNNTSS